MTRTRAERTTHSEHFDWIEYFEGGTWSGQRNAMTLFRIQLVEYGEHKGDYCLSAPVESPVRNIDAHFDSPEEAMQAADKRFADWAHALGLKVDRQWWKDPR